MNKFLNIFDEKKKNDLKEEGYCIFEPNIEIQNWIGTDLNNLRTIIDDLINKEGDKAGFEGREEFYQEGKKFGLFANRLGNLPNKSRFFFNFCCLPINLLAAKEVIKNEICLSSSNFREPLKNSKQQALHIDWLPRQTNEETFDCVVAMYYLDDSNEANGAIKLIPKTHKILSYPDKYCNPNLDHPDEVTISMKAGSVIILNANIWHRGGANLDGSRRRIINAVYRNRRLKQGLCQKKYLDNKLIETMSEKEKYLFKVALKDEEQTEKIYGPGNHYRDWLKNNPEFDYSKP